ncbi:ExbD/TolR family protein [Pseudoxanthomonas wuyuanensis]|uniref:Outer membrane transport energization protein ExbD n=1 Tax=Pseudoxanthomonas wuyuanensis TaxID=1073196 RepID=A0A286DER0_9GAMM|nr:biopolymer transporter ExbD [Pseudoxanthomonas wuyuanensis]KAF1719897.1 biopolymer transporter ExbD [Pseudoxanthomonas wuyuanensis]SOD57145.1 outer membrane transport energization protein ExbD [Pseudoxanthomonas wuyuanensis]
MAFSAAASTGSGSGPALAEINITPLVDVMLVLLVIFMVTAPMLSRPLQLSLPQSSDQVSPLKPRQLDLAVAADGSLRLDDRPIAAAELQRQLEEAASADPDTLLRIRAAGDADYQQLVAALALARNSGLMQIGLAR